MVIKLPVYGFTIRKLMLQLLQKQRTHTATQRTEAEKTRKTDALVHPETDTFLSTGDLASAPTKLYLHSDLFTVWLRGGE